MRVFATVALLCAVGLAVGRESGDKPRNSDGALITNEPAGKGPGQTMLVEEQSKFVVLATLGTYALATGIANALAKDSDASSLETRMENARASIEKANDNFCRASVCATAELMQEIMVRSQQQVDVVNAEITAAEADEAFSADEDRVEALGFKCVSLRLLHMSNQMLDGMTSSEGAVNCKAACKAPSAERARALEISTAALEEFAKRKLKVALLSAVKHVMDKHHMGWLFDVGAVGLAYGTMDQADFESAMENAGMDALSTLIIGEPIMVASIAAITQTFELGQTIHGWVSGSTEAKQVALVKGSIRERLVNMQYLFCRETASSTVTIAAMAESVEMDAASKGALARQMHTAVNAVCPPAWLDVGESAATPLDFAEALVRAASDTPVRGITEFNIFPSESKVPKEGGWKTATLFDERLFVGALRPAGAQAGDRATLEAQVSGNLGKVTRRHVRETGVRADYRYNADSWLGGISRSDSENIQDGPSYCPSTDSAIAYKIEEGITGQMKYITDLVPDFRQLKDSVPGAMKKTCSKVGSWNTAGMPAEISKSVRSYVSPEANRAADKILREADRSVSSRGAVGSVVTGALGAVGAVDADGAARREEAAADIRYSVQRFPFCSVCKYSDKQPFMLDLAAVRQSNPPIVGVSVMRRNINAGSVGDPLHSESTIAANDQHMEDVAGGLGFFMSRNADLDACYHKHKDAIKLWSNPCEAEHHALVIHRDLRIHTAHLKVGLVATMRQAVNKAEEEKTRQARAAAEAEADARVVTAVHDAIASIFSTLEDESAKGTLTVASVLSIVTRSPTLETVQAVSDLSDAIVALGLDSNKIRKASFMGKALADVALPAVAALVGASASIAKAATAEPPHRAPSAAPSPFHAAADGTKQPPVGTKAICMVYARTTDVSKDGKLTLDDIAASSFAGESAGLDVAAMTRETVNGIVHVGLAKKENDGRLTATALTESGVDVNTVVEQCVSLGGDIGPELAREKILDAAMQAGGREIVEWVLGKHAFEAIVPAKAWPTMNRYWTAVAGSASATEVSFEDYVQLIKAARPEWAEDRVRSVVRNDFLYSFRVGGDEAADAVNPLTREAFFSYFVVFDPPRASDIWRRRMEGTIVELSLARAAPIDKAAMEAAAKEAAASLAAAPAASGKHTAASVLGGADHYKQIVGDALDRGVCIGSSKGRQVTAEMLKADSLKALLPGVDLAAVATLPADCHAWAGALLGRLTEGEESSWPLAWRAIGFSAAFVHEQLAAADMEETVNAEVRIKAVLDKEGVVRKAIRAAANPLQRPVVAADAAMVVFDALSGTGASLSQMKVIEAQMKSVKTETGRDAIPDITFELFMSKTLEKIVAGFGDNQLAAVAALHGIQHTVPRAALVHLHASRQEHLRGSAAAGGDSAASLDSTHV